MQEVICRQLLIHPTIINLAGFTLPTATEGGKIILEYCRNRSLEAAIRDRPRWWSNATVKMQAIVGIACGMRFTHSHEIIHRDLKPSNILFNDRYRIRISDFGISRNSSQPSTITQGVGTPFYMAPEISGSVEYMLKVDVYSFAILLYEIIVGTWAWPRDLTPAQLLKRVVVNIDRPQIPDSVVPFTRDLITRCWA
jgi:serine/threonine protein kinase